MIFLYTQVVPKMVNHFLITELSFISDVSARVHLGGKTTSVFEQREINPKNCWLYKIISLVTKQVEKERVERTLCSHQCSNCREQ